jgi:hypothetical protein
VAPALAPRHGERGADGVGGAVHVARGDDHRLGQPTGTQRGASGVRRHASRAAAHRRPLPCRAPAASR